jgi:hypothetical protein
VGNHHFIHTNGFASCLLNSRGFVLGKQSALVNAFDRNGPPRMSPDLLAALEHVDPERGISVAIALAGLQKFPLNAKIRADIQAIAINIELADDVKIDAAIICRDRAAADSVTEKINGAQFGETGVVVPREVRMVMDSLEIQKADAIVRLKLRLDAEKAIVLAGVIRGLMPADQGENEAP